jgi:hypothetical protein
MRTPDTQDVAVAYRLIEVMLDRCNSDDAFESIVPWRERMAARKSLESSRILLGVVHHLMLPPDSLKPAETAARLKTVLENIKTAARGAYQAGLLLTGTD